MENAQTYAGYDQQEYSFGGSLYPLWRDAFEAWAAWFFYDTNYAGQVNRLRQDLRQIFNNHAQLGISTPMEEAALNMRDEDLLALARYWSYHYPTYTEDDRRIPDEPK